MFEFDEDQDNTIAETSAALRDFGAVALVTSLLVIGIAIDNLVIGGLAPGAMLNLVVGFVEIAIAGLVFAAGNVLVQIVRTDSDDLEHLMRGLRRLAQVYTLQAALMLASIAMLAWTAVELFK